MKPAYYILLLLIVLLASCVESVVLPIADSEPVLTVEGSVTNEYSRHKIKLTSSNRFYESGGFVPVSGAMVSVVCESRTYMFQETEPGLYQPEQAFAGEVGKTYELLIEVDFDEDGDAEQYRASTTMNPVPHLDQIEVKLKVHDDSEYVSWRIYPYFQDNGDTEDYYLAKVAINNVMVKDSLSRWVITDDELFNGRYVKGYYYFASLYSKWPEQTVNLYDKLTLYFFGIPKEYYEFLSDARNNVGSNPFMGPPANVRSNIYPPGKSAGFFYAAAKDSASAVLVEIVHSEY